MTLLIVTILHSCVSNSLQLHDMGRTRPSNSFQSHVIEQARCPVGPRQLGSSKFGWWCYLAIKNSSRKKYSPWQCWKCQISFQSLYRDMSSTQRWGSWGRCSGFWKNDLRESLKATGVGNSWHLSKWERMTLNIASMSSCECPLVKKDICAAPSLCKQIQRATTLNIPIFLTSFAELSACNSKNTHLISSFVASFVNPAARISAVLALPVVTRLGLSASSTI